MDKHKDLPFHYEAFLSEYEALCRKYNLMVFSDGESVEIGKADDALWGLREGSLSWLTYLELWHPGEHQRILEEAERRKTKPIDDETILYAGKTCCQCRRKLPPADFPETDYCPRCWEIVDRMHRGEEGAHAEWSEVKP